MTLNLTLKCPKILSAFFTVMLIFELKGEGCIWYAVIVQNVTFKVRVTFGPYRLLCWCTYKAVFDVKATEIGKNTLYFIVEKTVWPCNIILWSGESYDHTIFKIFIMNFRQGRVTSHVFFYYQSLMFQVEILQWLECQNEN